MDPYALEITFKASPSSTFMTRELGLPSTLGQDVVAEWGGRSVRVGKAKSPAEATQMAEGLQSAFRARALPPDIEERLRDKFR